MKKIFLIGWKDVKLAFRDRAALILMLAAPFLLTLGMGFVTGRFSGSSSSGMSNIPVVIVNQMKASWEPTGQAVPIRDLADLLEPTSRYRPGRGAPGGRRGQARGGDCHPGRVFRKLLSPAQGFRRGSCH